jgi:hypothetical protein
VFQITDKIENLLQPRMKALQFENWVSGWMLKFVMSTVSHKVWLAGFLTKNYVDAVNCGWKNNLDQDGGRIIQLNQNQNLKVEVRVKTSIGGMPCQ